MEAVERPCCRQTEAAVARGRRVVERMRPSCDGSQHSTGRFSLKTLMICASSASSRKPSSTALREALRLVLCSPELLSAFQMAPDEPPSKRW